MEFRSEAVGCWKSQRVHRVLGIDNHPTCGGFDIRVWGLGFRV